MFTRDDAPKVKDPIWVEGKGNGTVCGVDFDDEGHMEEIRVVFSDDTIESYTSETRIEPHTHQWRVYPLD